jgi:Cu2+-exporting ATPase
MRCMPVLLWCNLTANNMATAVSNTNNKRIPALAHETFPVLGMSCAGCAVSVESTLKAAPGVANAQVNFASQSVLVDYDQAVTKPADLKNAVQSIGYDLVVDVEDPQKVKEEAQRNAYQEIKRRTIGSSVLALPVFILGMFFMDRPFVNYISMVLTAPIVFYFGRVFFVNAWKQAKHRSANMDTLVALSTGIAFLFSVYNTIFPEFWHSRGVHPHVYYEAAAVVIAFISLGKLLEERAKSKTSSSLKKLLSLQPSIVKVIAKGIETEVPIAAVKHGDHIIVRPGERIAVDGMVVSGTSFIDESMISGEPVPAEKKTGDQVFAGTINQKGSFEFEATKVGGDTLLAHIIKKVAEAQGSKAPVQKLVDKVAGIFVPVVITISVITFIAWMTIGGENAFTHALLTSVTVLVIACPCALGLATPTAIMVGIGKGAENNILIRDAESLELAHRVNAIVLDKTGTITEGKPIVTDILWNNNDYKNYQGVLYSIESRSEHPLATAVADKLKSVASPIMLNAFESITGRGVKAAVNGDVFFVGNRRLMEENGISLSNDLAVTASIWENEAKTVVFFSNNKDVLAIIAVADRIKPTSIHAIKTLYARGIEVYMLTGDNRQTAKSVSELVGIFEYRAEMLPSAKADFIKALQQQGKVVAMAGDGINDAQALAQADVSIAMGKGSDIAMDVAKVTLMTSDLQMLPKVFDLSTKTVRAVRQNLFWAFIYNVIGIPLAAGVLYPVNGFLLDPMIAGGAMAFSSVSVVANSLRLKAAKI